MAITPINGLRLSTSFSKLVSDVYGVCEIYTGFSPHPNSGTARPLRIKEKRACPQGEVWRGRDAKTYRKCNVFARQLW